MRFLILVLLSISCGRVSFSHIGVAGDVHVVEIEGRKEFISAKALKALAATAEKIPVTREVPEADDTQEEPEEFVDEDADLSEKDLLLKYDPALYRELQIQRFLEEHPLNSCFYMKSYRRNQYYQITKILDSEVYFLTLGDFEKKSDFLDVKRFEESPDQYRTIDCDEIPKFSRKYQVGQCILYSGAIGYIYRFQNSGYAIFREITLEYYEVTWDDDTWLDKGRARLVDCPVTLLQQYQEYEKNQKKD